MDNLVGDTTRLETLRKTGLLDSPPEAAFDRLTRLASKILRTPVALVSLVDKDRQFFKSQVGLPEPWASMRQTPLSHSFCQHMVTTLEPLVVPDAREHPFLKDNLAVPELGVVAYAGVPLVSQQQGLGALCVIEDKPRDWTDDEVEILRELGQSVITEIELRHAVRLIRDNEDLYRTMGRNIPHGAIFLFDRDMRYELAEGTAIQELTNHESEYYVGKLAFDASTPANRAVVRENYQAALAGETRDMDLRVDAQFAALHTAPVKSANGEIERGMAFLYNITSRKQLEARLVAQTQHLELLSRVGEEVNKASGMREALARLLELLCSKWEYAVGHVFLRKDDAGRLLSTDLWWFADADRYLPFKEATERTDFAPGKGLPGRVVQTHKPFWSVSFPKDLFTSRTRSAEECNLRCALAFPVLVGNEVAAVIEFFATRPEPPNQSLLYVMESMGLQVGRIIERERHAARIEVLSTTDELTQLHNRRGFIALAQQQIKMAERNVKPLLLLFADLDGLKTINDSLGHKYGDAVIAEAGEVLRQSFRDSDIVARLGGDEFVVMMPDTDMESSAALLARLTSNVAKANAKQDRVFTLSVSTGVTRFDPTHPETVDTLINRADALMYEQKQARKKDRDTTAASGTFRG